MKKYIKDRMLRGYDLNFLAVISVATLVIVLKHYYPLNIDFFRVTELIYYLLVPLAVGWLLFRDKPSEYGIRIGRWKTSIVLAAACLAAMAMILYGAGKIPEFRSYYHTSAIDWPMLLLDAALYMFAWEFIFRGYMLFGLEKSIGKGAIFVQAIPFVLLHFGKPFLETLFCLPGGFILGYVAYRTRSFLPCFIIHFGIYIGMIYFANF